MTKLLHFLIACAGIKASNVNLEIPVKLRALTCTAKSSKLAKSNDDEPVPVEIKFIKVFTYFTPNAPKDDGDCFKFYLALDPKTGNDLLTPIPSDFPLPVGDYIFTYDNRAKNLTHNLVIEDEDKKDVGTTSGPHPLIVARMDLVTLEAGVTLYRFYCQVHDSLPPGVRDPPMDFFCQVIGDWDHFISMAQYGTINPFLGKGVHNSSVAALSYFPDLVSSSRPQDRNRGHTYI